MGLRTADEFLVGLRDAREVYYRGERVEQVPDHPELGVVARHVAIVWGAFIQSVFTRPNLARRMDGLASVLD